MQCFFHFFFGEHKFRVELHGNLRPGTSLISMERVTFCILQPSEWGGGAPGGAQILAGGGHVSPPPLHSYATTRRGCAFKIYHHGKLTCT